VAHLPQHLTDMASPALMTECKFQLSELFHGRSDQRIMCLALNPCVFRRCRGCEGIKRLGSLRGAQLDGDLGTAPVHSAYASRREHRHSLNGSERHIAFMFAARPMSNGRIMLVLPARFQSPRASGCEN
jgi:hypothetical protein